MSHTLRAYEPLILDTICIGMVGFHSRDATKFKDPEKIAIVRSLARRAAAALHDYLIEQEIREKVETDALSDILGLVLHNVKTPLAATRIASRLLLERIEATCTITPEMKELIDIIGEQLMRISHLRDMVLKLKSPPESRIELTQFPDFLHKTVEGAIVSSEGVTPEYTLDPGIGRVLIDRPAMRLCLEVLLQNAVDAMKENEGEKLLRVVLRPASDAENRKIESALPGLAVDVIDNGCGVPDDAAKDLFRKMTSLKPKGFGMGLLHCRVFAHSAQGTVYYDDAHKDGAKFTLIFPYRHEKEV